MHSALNIVKGLESESIECRTACLGALNKLLPQHGIDVETTAIEDYLSHRYVNVIYFKYTGQVNIFSGSTQLDTLTIDHFQNLRKR